MSSNYPPGVTGNEAIFQGAEERTQHVVCDTEEEVSVLPTFAIRTAVTDLVRSLKQLQELPVPAAVARLASVDEQALSILEEVGNLENIGSWECDFEGDVEVTRDSDTTGLYECPRCGLTGQTTWEEYTHEDFLADQADRARDEAIDARLE